MANEKILVVDDDTNICIRLLIWRLWERMNRRFSIRLQNFLPYCGEAVQLSVEGPVRILGPSRSHADVGQTFVPVFVYAHSAVWRQQFRQYPVHGP